MKELVLLTARETQIQTIHWQAEGQSLNKVLLMVHSYGDMCTRYDWLARYFTKQGWDVVSFDLASHGRSGGLRSKWRSVDDLIEDIACVMWHYKQELKDKTWVGFGMGFGATLLNLYELKTENSDFEKFLFWAPMIRLSTRFPKVLIDSIRYVNSFTAHLNVLTLQAALLTSNTESLYASIPDWDEDFGKVSAQTAGILIDSGKVLIKRWEELTKPTWIGWGENDQFVDSSLLKKKEEEALDCNKTFEHFSEATHFLDQNELGYTIAKKMNAWLFESVGQETLIPA